LQQCNEILGARLATHHNLHYYLGLMREIREAIESGRFAALVSAWLAADASREPQQAR
jgi:queuine tRNA-ribosyltransferase